MQLRRLLKHLLMPRRVVHRAFPHRAWEAVDSAIREAELSHDIEIRVVVEASLPFPALLRGRSSRDRALELFSQLRVWDTEHNTGVLIYVLFADTKLEIVADRGISAKVQQAEWDAICDRITRTFREGRFEEGALLGISEIGALVKARIPPPGDPHPDELPDKPLVL